MDIVDKYFYCGNYTQVQKLESVHSHFMWNVGHGPGQTAPASHAGPFMLQVTLSNTVHHSPRFLGGIVECCNGPGRRREAISVRRMASVDGGGCPKQ